MTETTRNLVKDEKDVSVVFSSLNNSNESKDTEQLKLNVKEVIEMKDKVKVKQVEAIITKNLSKSTRKELTNTSANTLKKRRALASKPKQPKKERTISAKRQVCNSFLHT